jgi:uncharacterized protein YlxW (UPF0749 family)
LRKLRIERLQRERDKLQREIEAAAQAQDSVRLRELLMAKPELEKELRKLGRA